VPLKHYTKHKGKNKNEIAVRKGKKMPGVTKGTSLPSRKPMPGEHLRTFGQRKKQNAWKILRIGKASSASP